MHAKYFVRLDDLNNNSETLWNAAERLDRGFQDVVYIRQGHRLWSLDRETDNTLTLYMDHGEKLTGFQGAAGALATAAEIMTSKALTESP